MEIVDIVVNLELYTNLYFSNGADAPYKLINGNEINVKPVLVKDYPIYDGCIDIIQLAKNEANDIRIIQMSYLQYLMEIVLPQDNEEHVGEIKLRTLLKLCLGCEYLYFAKNNGKWNIIICNKEGVVENLITPRDFNDIMIIILNQNNPNYDNRIVNPEVRDVMQEYYKIKYADITQPTLEKRKAFVSSKTNKNFLEIGQMSIREFELVYRACLDSELYLAIKITEASFKYEVKNPTNHPLFEREHDAFEEAFSDTTTLQNKGFKGAESIGIGLE